MALLRSRFQRGEMAFGVILIAAALAISPAPPAHAESDVIPGSKIEKGGWTLSAVRDENKRFSACMTIGRIGEHILLMQLYRTAQFDLYVINHDWTISEGSENKVTLRLDGGVWRNAMATGISPGYFIELERDPSFFHALIEARRLTVVGQGGEIILDLTGGRSILAELEPCLKTYGGIDAAGNRVVGGSTGSASNNPIEGGKGSSNPIEGGKGGGAAPADTASSNPFAPAPPASTTGDRTLDQDIASFTAMLRQAGLSSPSVTLNSDGDVVWTSGGSEIGGLISIRAIGSSGASQTLQNLVKSVAKICKGHAEPAYDKIERYSGGQVFSGRLPCQASGYEVVFVVFEDGRDLIALVNYGPLYEADLLRRVNQALREQVLRL